MRLFQLCASIGILMACAAAGQEARTLQRQDVVSPRPSAEKPAPAVTPEQKQQALQLLENAKAETADLSPGLRAYALTQVARAYSRMDSSKVVPILEEAFQAAVSIPPEENYKSDLERDILAQMLPLNRARVEELLPQCEPKARKQAMTSLAGIYVQEKKFDQAHDTIQQITNIEEFPYAVGTELMLALPKEEAGLRLSVFSEALTSYVAHEHKGFSFGRDDFSGMVIRFRRTLPSGQVMQAVDELLKEAKEGDNGSVTLSGTHGRASFASYYEFRLFQLLPVIREIDPGKADSLARDYQNVQAILKQYPNGQQSLDPTLKDTPPGNDERGSLSFHVNGSKGGGTRPPATDEPMLWNDRARQIMELARKDPTQALAQAQTLPVRVGFATPKKDALLAVIAQTWKEKASIARSALQELVKAADTASPVDKVDQYVDAARYYIKMEDQESAQKLLAKCPAPANEAIKQDANADDPNKALKAYWPSTNSWRKLLQVANQVSPDLTGELMKEISDPEIKTLARVDLAKAIVGAPNGQTIIAVQRGKQTSISRFEDAN